MRKILKFLLGDELREIEHIDPTLTLLDYLRQDEGRTGTKEGCAEGDCGACTTVIGTLEGGKIHYRPLNACIQFMPCLDGKQVLTVEDLQSPDGTLHPVQKALVETHGSQCGFCTPGFVMSLFALHRQGKAPTRAAINNALAGNLCRCTGYGPIIQAAEKMFADGTENPFAAQEKQAAKILSKIAKEDSLAMVCGKRTFFAPKTSGELAKLLLEHPQAILIAGQTDAGLWVTKQHRVLETIISLSAIAELKVLKQTKSHIEIGAGVTYAEAHDMLARHFPDLGELIRRLGSTQIRNAGTIGGNIANGSPIGDSSPPLIVLEAELVLRKGDKIRTIALEDFFVSYGKQDIQTSEFIEKIKVPLPGKNDLFRCYKLTKRFDQDISAVCGAFRLRLEGDRVGDIRICFGGMAATPARAVRAEQALAGKIWNEETVSQAMAALEKDYTPLSDMRGSAEYRMKSAQNLLRKFYLESSNPKPASIRVLEVTP